MLGYFLLGLFLTVSCDEGQREIVLFDQADENNDDVLTRVELDDLFFLFDSNNDTSITPTEFVNDWTTLFKIGGIQEAQTLFTRADTNDDGYITSKDLPAVFSFFDINGDGSVDIGEFLTQWGTLALHPVGSVDVTVDVTKEPSNFTINVPDVVAG